jgi:hypothetical protein
MGMSGGPVPFPMSAAAMLKRIRELAEDTDNIALTRHAIERMAERQITRPMIVRVLRIGVIVEGPTQDIRGDWQCTMRRFGAGQELHVSLVTRGKIVVITVF